jgi:hypothetical protein
MELTVMMECQCIPIHHAEQITAVVDSTSSSRKQQVLRAQKKYVLIAYVLNRRALPHITEILVAGHFELTYEIPVFGKSVRLINDNAAVLVLSLGSKQDIILISLFVVV